MYKSACMEIQTQNSTHTFELAVNSASRDLVVDAESHSFEVVLKSNPIKYVTKLSLVDTYIPKLRTNLTQARIFQYTWFDTTGLDLCGCNPGAYPIPEDLSTRFTTIVNLQVLDGELPFHDIYGILANLSANMSLEQDKTVAWSVFGDRIKVTSSHQLILWPLAPKPSSTVDSHETWDYVSSTLFRVLGFDVSQGPVVLLPNVPFVTPYAYNLSGPPYVLLKLYANGQPIGRLWELDAGGTRVGPYFARLNVVNSVSDVCVCNDYKNVDHEFGSPTTITKLVFELNQPVVGLAPKFYKMWGRDWIANFVIERSSRNLMERDNEAYIEFQNSDSDTSYDSD